jgi:signal transduction histidine kinase/ligand-binding sensor domain-containing protein
MLKHKNGSFYIFKPIYKSQNCLQIQDSIRLPENIHIMSNLAIDKNTFWIGTQQGLYYKEGKQIIHLTEKEGLANNFINHVCQDYEGNIWLATFGGGVQKIKANYLTHYEIGLDNTKVHDAWQTGRQDFHVAHNTGIQPIRAGKTQLRLFSENNMRCIMPTQNGFYATNFEYIFSLTPQGQIAHKVRNTNGIADIAEWQGRWYAATFGQGVVEIGRDSTKLLFEQDFPTTGLMAERLVKTKDYLWWLTHEHGVQAIDKNLQLTHIEGLAGKGVYDVFEQKDGTLWFATNKGVMKKSPKEGKNMMMRFEERVVTVFEWAGKMWAISDKFLYTSFEEKGVLKWRKWGSVLILPAPDIKINKAIFRADFAHVLLCTNKGLVVLDLQKINLPTATLKPLQLLDLQIDSTKRNLNFQGKFYCLPTENNLTFRFAGLSFLEESQNVLHYELILPTGKRVGKSADMKLVLNELASGDYTLRVWLENPNGITSKVWQARFVIATPFWWQWWFWAISAFFVSIMTGLIVRFFIRQAYQKRIKQMEVEHKIQLERQRISRDLHDNVGAQLSYILRALDNLSSEGKNARVQNLQFFAKETMRNLRESIWAIQKESITTKELFLRFKKYVHTFAQDTHLPTMSLQQNLPTEQTLSPTQALHLFRMLQEALQNALKHSQANAIHILFDISKEGNFCIMLQDDGVGFDVEAGKAKEGYYGLRNLEERAQEIGAQFSLESAVGKGTTLVIQL